MTKDRKRRQKELERRLRARGPSEMQAGLDVDAAVATALSHPDRFAEALRGFSARALMTPNLAAFRFPRRPFVEAFVAAEPPAAEASDDERRRAVRRAILPRFATQAALHDLVALLRHEVRDVKTNDDLLGLLAVLTLAGACTDAGAPPEHVFWELVFDLTLTDALLSGDLVTAVALRELAADDAAVKTAADAFARALAQGDAGRELDGLGIDVRDPAELAAAWREATVDPDGYHVQFDATLHLLDAQTELSLGEVGTRLLATALDQAGRERIARAVAAAFDEDMNEATLEELARWARARLKELRDEPPAEVAADLLARERVRCAVLLLSLRALPRGGNPLLRAIHARGLVRARRFAAELEVPFVHRISAAPDDAFALDDYERLLIELGELPRARRVRRYHDAVRRRPRPQTVSDPDAGVGATS